MKGDDAQTLESADSGDDAQLSSEELVALDVPLLPDADLKMALHSSADQIISRQLREKRVWEYYETQLTLRHLKAGDVFVDVGANIGYYSLIASRKVGASGKVIAYEPDPDNFALLQKNLSLNDCHQVLAFPYALYDSNKQGSLYLSEDNFGDHRIYVSPQERATRAVRLVNGAEHLARHTQHIDFLKIDTQGAEYFVVNGLKPLIKANQDHLKMVLEFTPFGLRHSGASGGQLLRLLDTFGMEYYIIDHHKDALIPIPSKILNDWINETDQAPNNEGFMNLFVTPRGYRAF